MANRERPAERAQLLVRLNFRRYPIPRERSAANIQGDDAECTNGHISRSVLHQNCQAIRRGQRLTLFEAPIKQPAVVPHFLDTRPDSHRNRIGGYRVLFDDFGERLLWSEEATPDSGSRPAPQSC